MKVSAEGLRRNHGDAAGAKLAASPDERITVNATAPRPPRHHQGRQPPPRRSPRRQGGGRTELITHPEN